jgi:hypothetical protein
MPGWAGQDGGVAADGVARARSSRGGGLCDDESGLVCRHASLNVRRGVSDNGFDESPIPPLQLRAHPGGEIGGGGGAAVGHPGLHSAGLDDDDLHLDQCRQMSRRGPGTTTGDHGLSASSSICTFYCFANYVQNSR